MLVRDHLLIGGSWVAAKQPSILEVASARDGSALGRVTLGGAQDAHDAIEAAQVAFDKWRGLPPEDRARFLDRIADHLEFRAHELAELIAREVGMPIRHALRIQVELPIANLREAARIAREFEFSAPLGHSLIQRQPVGVVAALTPWNYPLHQMVLKIAPALAAGCTVVLKPSEVTPFIACELADAAMAASLPPGVLNVVPGRVDAGRALVEHPGVEKVSFTGSTEVGKQIAAAAAHTLKRVTLELGGKSAAVVLDGDDIESAVRHTIKSCFLNAGQTCTALTRLIVPAAHAHRAALLAAELAEAMTVGDPLLDGTQMGPLVSHSHMQRVQALVRQGIEEGATLLTGGAHRPDRVPDGGAYMRPTVFCEVAPDMRIAQEEIFGPVLAVLPHAGEEDAVRIANATPYGLAGSVWTSDTTQATRVARHLRVGQVDINGAKFNRLAPFGGFKQSGYGREAGVYGLEDFLEYQAVQLPQ
jgi:betaine-aldehyde dehydrogenase